MSHSYNKSNYKDWYMCSMSFGKKFPKFTRKGTSKARRNSINITNSVRRTSEKIYTNSIKKDLYYLVSDGDTDRKLLSRNFECSEPWNW